MPDAEIDRWIEEMPEPKLELLDGRLSVGNGAGNLRLLHHLLDGWGAEAALPMAPAAAWWQALHQAFARFEPPGLGKPAEVWSAWANHLSYSPDLPLAGPMVELKHRRVRLSLTMGLYELTGLSRFAHVTGPDVIMRLGEDAFTPDVFVIGPESSGRLNQYYQDGPADLAIEVLLRGHESYDREVRRRGYAAGGVGEYWIVDPRKESVEFLRLQAGEYRPHPLGSDGSYTPRAFAGLSFHPEELWKDEKGWGRGPNPFSVAASMPGVPAGYAEGGVRWGHLEFNPQPDLQPRRISFEEFVSWAPPAKFECINGKPWVGGSRGSRNVIGLLLRTEGLTQAVGVLHPREWIAALVKAEKDRADDPARRETWWKTARRAAVILRRRFGEGRLAVIGDLVRSQPLNLWSDITFVTFDALAKADSFEAYQALHKALGGDIDLDVISHDRATCAQKRAVAEEAVDL